MVPILLAGLAVRFWVASLTYLDLDEAYQSRLATPGFPDLWRNALEPTQPPLLILLLHVVRYLGQTEITMRLIPVLAGGLFPWFVYRWLGLVRGKAAGFIGLTILVAAPNVISLSAQVRAYSLGLLFTSAALYFLERAIREGSLKWMGWFTATFLLAVLSVFSTAFFCVAIGVYFLIRVWDLRSKPRVILLWVASQVAALGIYAYLYVVQVAGLHKSHQVLITEPSWFQGRFPAEGDRVAQFFWRGTFGVVEFVFTSHPVTLWAVVLLAFGIVVLLLSRSAGLRNRVGLVVLLASPFLLACAGAFLYFHPYGPTRQTIFLVVFLAAGMAIAMDWLARRRLWVSVLAMMVLVPMVYDHAGYHPLRIDPTQRPELLHSSFDYLREQAPPGSLVLTESDTGALMEFYLAGDDWPSQSYPSGARRIVGYRVFYNTSRLMSLDQVRADLAEWRSREEIDPEAPVWVIDASGISDLYHELQEHPGRGRNLSDLQTFGEAVTVFRVPAGYQGPETGPDA